MAYRVTYAIDESLRGEPVDVIEIADLIGRGLPAFSATTGERHLVFAEKRPVGAAQVIELVPVGRDQGVFYLTENNSAVNARDLSIELDELSSRFAE
jgi:hypothetical protein